MILILDDLHKVSTETLKQNMLDLKKINKIKLNPDLIRIIIHIILRTNDALVHSIDCAGGRYVKIRNEIGIIQKKNHLHFNIFESSI